MSAAGDLGVAGARDGVGDLPGELRPYDQVVLEAQDQARAADGRVRGQPVGDQLEAELAADRGQVDGGELEDVQPVPQPLLIGQGLRGQALQRVDIGGVAGRQLDPAVGQVHLRDRLGGGEGVGPAAGRHQHGRPDEFGPGQDQLLDDDAAQGEAHDPARARAEVLDEARDVRRHVVEGEALGAGIARRDPAVVHGDHLEAGRLERGHLVGAPHSAGGPGAGHHDDRVPRSVLLVVQLDPVDPDDRHRQAGPGCQSMPSSEVMSPPGNIGTSGPRSSPRKARLCT
ncbi:hypothetical protein GCM10009574_024300 [Streptomyces asiaticus]